MRKVILLFAVASLAAGAAHATVAPDAPKNATPRAATGDKTPAVAVTAVAYAGAAPQRQLYICDENEDARLVAPAAAYGFVTAKQVRAGQTWSGAKCITASEIRKLSAAK